MWYMCTTDYYSAIRKNEILSFASTWMDLEGITLSEISHTKTNTVRYHLYVESKRNNNLVHVTKRSRLTDKENKLVGTSGEREGGRGNIGVGDEEFQTTRYEISYEDILCSTENTANIL